MGGDHCRCFFIRLPETSKRNVERGMCHAEFGSMWEVFEKNPPRVRCENFASVPMNWGSSVYLSTFISYWFLYWFLFLNIYTHHDYCVKRVTFTGCFSRGKAPALFISFVHHFNYF